MKPSESEQAQRRARVIATLALTLPEHPMTRDVLEILLQSYRIGWKDAQKLSTGYPQLIHK